jgi:hypothetical protein
MQIMEDRRLEIQKTAKQDRQKYQLIREDDGVRCRRASTAIHTALCRWVVLLSTQVVLLSIQRVVLVLRNSTWLPWQRINYSGFFGADVRGLWCKEAGRRHGNRW